MNTHVQVETQPWVKATALPGPASAGPAERPAVVFADWPQHEPLIRPFIKRAQKQLVINNRGFLFVLFFFFKAEKNYQVPLTVHMAERHWARMNSVKGSVTD